MARGYISKRVVHHWTQAEVDFVRINWGKMTLGQMATHLELTVGQVDHRGKRMRLGFARRRKVDPVRLAALHAAGATETALSLEFAVCRETIRQWLVHLGLRQRQPPRNKHRVRHDVPHVCPNQRGWFRDQYGDEESEFLTAVRTFRDRHGRPPTPVEGFRLAQSLGWSKMSWTGSPTKGGTPQTTCDRRTTEPTHDG